VQGWAFLLIYFIKQKSLTKTKHKMEQTNNMTAATTATRPQFLTVLCILSYIGSGLWALLSLIGIFASGAIIGLLAGDAMSSVDTSGMTPEQAEQFQAVATGGIMGMLSSYAIVIFVVSLIFASLSLFGVIRMWKMKKSGFWLYSIPNGLIAVLGLIGGSIFGPIIGVAFIVMYALNLKHMH
jgi:hypothetical protein